MKPLQWLNGRKTYFVAGAMIVYAILGYSLGEINEQQASLIVFNALGFVGLRHSVEKKQGE